MNYKGNDKYGALPRRTMIANQPHMLAYINPQEEMLLRQLGGTGQAGPMGVPAYPPGDGGFSPDGSGGYGGGGGFGGYGGMGGGYGRDDYAGGNTSVGSYNAAVSRASQPLSRDYNATDRNRDLAAISSYNATATTSAPVEVEVAPVSIDSGMGAAIAANDGISFTDSTSVPTSNIGVNTGLSGEEFDDIGVANNTGSGGVSAGVTGTDFDFGMGSDDGVGSSAGDSSAGEVTVDPTNTSGGTTTSIVGTSMFDNMRALRGLPPLGETVSDVDTSRSNIGSSGYVSLDAIADNSGVSDIGPSGYVSLDAIADTKVDPETNYSDSDTVYDDQILRDLIGQNYTDLQSEIGNITDSDTVYDDQILRDLIGQNYTDLQSEIGNITDSDTVYDDQILRDLIGQNYTDLQSEIGNITDSDTVYDDQILRDLIGQNYTDLQSEIGNITDSDTVYDDQILRDLIGQNYTDLQSEIGNITDSDTVYDDQILRDLIGQNYTDLQSEIGNITDSDTVYDDQILRDLIGQNYTDFQSQIDNLTDRINNPYAIDITDTNIYTENPDGTYTVEDGEGGVDPYAIDITDTNIYTENPDGTYTVEDGEPDPIEMGGDGEGEPPANGGDGNGIDTTETTATTSIQDPAEYFNLFRSTAPSGWMRDSIWNSVGTGPDFDVDVYQEADGSLRFRETGELVPEEYMKYIDLARRTEMDAPEEETA